MKPEDRDISPDPGGTAAEEQALARARERLQGAGGETFWRRLEELAEERDFQKLLQRLVPGLAWPLGGALDRRHFFKIMGASLALAGLTACTKQPPEAIVPYINQPPEIVPGKPLFFTSAMPLGGAAYGILVESNMGRPTKIEGNPMHPGSLGATDAFGQAEILNLYDPDRSQTVLQFGKVSSWDAFYLTLVQELQAKRAARGAGLRVLTRDIISPTATRLMGEFLQAYPAARWHRWEPVSRDNIRTGTRLALGADLEPVYAFDQAGVILSLDSDFLMWEAGRLRYARDYSNRRRVRADRTEMNRLYVIESTPSITGAVADHRLAAPPARIESLARALASKLGVQAPASAGSQEMPAETTRWIEAVARDLQAHRGASLVVAGPAQPPEVQVLALAMNQALGNLGKTVRFIEPLEGGPADSAASLGELVRDMQAGKVDMLIILGGNPAYDAPADIPFAAAMQKVRLGIRHGLYEDETSLLCQWHLPETHFLESWGDARAHDGTATIIQPLIQPLYAGRSMSEVLAMMLQQPTPSSYQLVRQTWQPQLASRGDLEQAWSAALRDGIIAGTAAPARTATFRPEALARLASAPRRQPAAGELELIFQPDYSVWDGRYANNAWLQELPRPLTKITWENPALLGPATARKLGVDYMDVIEIESGGRKVSAPVWIVEGHAEDCLTLHLGYGRTYAGAVGTGVGVNAYALRTSGSPWSASGARASKSVGQHWEVATTRINRGAELRPVAPNCPIAEFRKDPKIFRDKTRLHDSPETLFPAVAYTGYKWGMMVDLNTCIGCNACIVACQAENNIPTVGKDQVIRSRAMHWLRVDRYYVNDDPEDPRTVFEPVPCMHCETAPCELVCPVGATVHSNEGLNEMIYNRCVGTRYCSNNCPYKVRRFNFLRFADMETMVLKMARNPEVSVRSRGVMEKCTYCVQRITNMRIEAENEGRRIREGEVLTACQAACPTNTIIFGDLGDPQSAVAAAARQPQAFVLLAQLNTRPRTNYLAHFDNLNPELEKKV